MYDWLFTDAGSVDTAEARPLNVYRLNSNTVARLVFPGIESGTINGVAFTKAEGGAEALLGSEAYSFIIRDVLKE